MGTWKEPIKPKPKGNPENFLEEETTETEQHEVGASPVKKKVYSFLMAATTNYPEWDASKGWKCTLSQLWRPGA